MRRDRHNDFKDSAPCNDCAPVIKTLNIKKIIYSKDNDNFVIIKPSNYYTDYSTLGKRLTNKK